MTTWPLVNCEFCGRDTRNKSRICRFCAGGHQHLREHAAAAMGPWTEYDDEAEYDYSEIALGPKQAEDRMDALWTRAVSEWRHI